MTDPLDGLTHVAHATELKMGYTEDGRAFIACDKAAITFNAIDIGAVIGGLENVRQQFSGEAA
jgi:hypothetical protein